MQIVYEQQQNFKVEAVAVLERYFSPTQDGECGTAESEAKRICQTYSIPEQELLPKVNFLAETEEFLIEHFKDDLETMRFLFTPLSCGKCLAWALAWNYISDSGDIYPYAAHTEAQIFNDVACLAAQYQDIASNPADLPDTLEGLIVYLNQNCTDLSDKWSYTTLSTRLDAYQRMTYEIVKRAADLLSSRCQDPEAAVQIQDCMELTKERAPQLLGRISPKQEALWRITFLPSTMAFNSIRFFTSESEIMVVVGSLYWTILHLTEKYSASDEQLLQYFKTLGDKSRLDIVRILKDRSYSGQELSKELGISQGTVSHHLNILIRDELISILKDGNRIRCTLNTSTVEHMINSIRQLLLT